MIWSFALSIVYQPGCSTCVLGKSCSGEVCGVGEEMSEVGVVVGRLVPVKGTPGEMALYDVPVLPSESLGRLRRCSVGTLLPMGEPAPWTILHSDCRAFTFHTPVKKGSVREVEFHSCLLLVHGARADVLLASRRAPQPRRPVRRTGISAPCQMYPNIGGKTITTIAAHTA